MAGSKRGGAAALAAVLGVLSACASSSPTTGHDARSTLSRRVETMSRDLDDARDQLEGAVTRYQELVDFEADDPVAAYAEFSRELEESRRQRAELDEARADMDAAAEDYFRLWEAEIGQFLDDNMRQRAQRRLDVVRKRYTLVQESLDPALIGTDMVLDRLHDQMLFLKYDLSPQAVSLLSRDAAQMHKDAGRLVQHMEKLHESAEQFIQSLDTRGGVELGPEEMPDAPTDNPVEDQG